MLGKLFKYEWKAVSWMNLLLVAISAGVTLLGVVYFQTPLWKEMIHGSMGSGALSSMMANSLGILLSIGGALTYILVLVGVRFGQMIFLGVRYYRSMFSDEGYLTHTLPVKPSSLLISKTVTAGCWMLIVNFLLLVFTVILVLAAILGVAPVSFGEAWDIFRQAMASILEEPSSRATLLLWLAIGLLEPFLNMGILFGSLTLGHYSRKNKGLMGILAYCGVSLAVSMLTVICNMILLSVLQVRGTVGQWFLVNGKSLSSLIVDIAVAAGLMIWAHAIVKNRLNLE